MIKYVGPMYGPSGYSDANRDYIRALSLFTNDITIKSSNRLNSLENIEKEMYDFLSQFIDKKINYKAVIHHYIPQHLERHVEKNKINIGYNTWETDKLPKHWVDKINKNLDAVFVPSAFNRAAYYHSGVEIPIEVIPHCLDTNLYEESKIDLQIQNRKDDVFKFISVFQWTERKNPVGLLKAYFTEFAGEDNVVLILKTYGSNDSTMEKNRLLEEIMQIKKNCNLNQYPPIYFIGDILNKNELISLYQQSDCFVLPTRGEGFGLPYAEAAITGNHVIATDFGGQREFLHPEFSELISYQLTPVYGMNWIPNYDSTMNWAEPNLIHLKSAMRTATKLSSKMDQIKEKANKHIKANLNYYRIGKLFIKTLDKYMS